MASKTRYSLPYKKCPVVKRCTAPSHFLVPNSRHCIDFYLPQGTPILASRSGKIIERESRYNKSYPDKSFIRKGNYVVIKHRDGAETIYGHLSWRSIRVRVGQKVKKGQILGFSGQIGYATYPHLHFGVYDSSGNNIRPIFDTPLPAKTSYQRYSLDKEFLIIRK